MVTRLMIRPSGKSAGDLFRRETMMAKGKLGNHLKQLSDDELQDWASCIMEGLTDKHAVALNVAGWKIVSTIDPAYRWPFGCKDTGWKCPEWCEDISKPEKAKPKLTVVTH